MASYSPLGRSACLIGLLAQSDRSPSRQCPQVHSISDSAQPANSLQGSPEPIGARLWSTGAIQRSRV